MDISILSCPICRSSMKKQASSIICSNNHCFDISKRGYINFLNKPVKENYGKGLWTARRKTCRMGFFAPMLDRIAGIVGSSGDTVLDAGCGEGSHLAYLNERLDIQAAGFDISKDGVYMAAGYANCSWYVADMTNMPFAANSFDTIINILSPSNYGEFKRCMKLGAKLIKVIPGEAYLKEIRHIYHNGSDYSNERVVNHLKEQFVTVDTINLKYTFAADSEQLKNIIAMTPLSWQGQVPENTECAELTAEFDILICV